MRDENTAKAALNGTLDGFKRITRRAFIYQVSRVFLISKWMEIVTG